MAAKPTSAMAATRALEMKVVMVGDIGVGKTSVAARFIKNTYADSTLSTIGASYMWKESMVQGHKIKFSVWDTAGQEQFHSLVPMYFRQAAAVILMYDLGNTRSLQATRAWSTKIQENAPEGVIVALVGNKCDLATRSVTREDAAELASDVGASINCECSAKTSKGVFELFDAIAQCFLQQQVVDEPRPRTNTVIPGSGDDSGKKRCLRCF